MLNRANIRRYKRIERLEYKGTRENIYYAEQYRPVVGLYHVSSQKVYIQILIGIEQIEKIFYLNTIRPNGGKRILILDGYNSYKLYEFITFYEEYGIILLYLPPYLIYIVQPLDVGIFSPLKTAYYYKIDVLLRA